MTAATPVSLIIQTRVAEAGEELYRSWQVRVGQMLESWPGFLGQEVVAPTPPVQVDWFVVQRFRDQSSAQAWLRSEELARMLPEVERYFVGDDEISLQFEDRQDGGAVSATAFCRVHPEHEDEFLEWLRRVFRAEAQFKGFLGHRFQRPVAGISDHWVVVLSFASDADLNRWLESPERA